MAEAEVSENGDLDNELERRQPDFLRRVLLRALRDVAAFEYIAFCVPERRTRSATSIVSDGHCSPAPWPGLAPAARTTSSHGRPTDRGARPPPNANV